MPFRRTLVALLTPTLGTAAAVGVPVAQAFWARRSRGQVGGPPEGVAGPVGSGPVGLRVAWLGDSLAAGVGAGHADETMAHLVAHHLADHHLADHHPATGGPGTGATVTVEMLAVPGATVADVLDAQLTSYTALGPVDLVVVSVGANDVAARTPLRHFAARYRTVLDTLDGTPVVVLGIPHLRDALRLPQPLRTIAGVQSRRFARAVQTAAHGRATVTVVDVAACTATVPKAERSRFLAGDRYHPSGAGYALWAAALVARLPAVLPTPAVA